MFHFVRVYRGKNFNRRNTRNISRSKNFSDAQNRKKDASSTDYEKEVQILRFQIDAKVKDLGKKRGRK